MEITSEKAFEREIEKILDDHREDLRGYRVYLFGSRARMTADNRSDFDLGVEGPEPLRVETFFSVEESFERIPMLYKVDWVDLNRASSRLKENVLREGRLFYEA